MAEKVTIRLEELRFKEGEIFYKDRHMYAEWSTDIPQDVLYQTDYKLKIILIGEKQFDFIGYKSKQKILEALYEPFKMYLKEKAYVDIYHHVRCCSHYDIGDIYFSISLTQDEVTALTRKDENKILSFLPNNYDVFSSFNKIIRSYRDVAIGDKCIPIDLADSYTGIIDENFQEWATLELKSAIAEVLMNIPQNVSNYLCDHGSSILKVEPSEGVLETSAKTGFVGDIILPVIDEKISLYFSFTDDIKHINHFQFSKNELLKIKNKIDSINEIEIKQFYTERYGALLPSHYTINHIFTEVTVHSTPNLREIYGKEFQKIRSSFAFYGEIKRAFCFTDPNGVFSDSYAWTPKKPIKTYMLVSVLETIYLIPEDKQLSTYCFPSVSDLPIALFSIWAYFSSSRENKRQRFSINFFSPMGIHRFTKI